ncbi:hypothetical protein POM88_032040 [Heracleum sosnowskyi]|uniref:TF-B3 domain-containing protein n=1 Tax=Heracleum sosnowskyi TaxID=360622 RepID=A0AAD8HYI7_9APIA|nr:hypothetical protein POM88_032040 [Heracleum sosnowskyi]
MGDREACDECKEKCSLFHGKRTDPSPLVTSFTKILFGNYNISKELFLPQKFSQAIPVLVAGEDCTIQDTNGHLWEVNLGAKDGRLAFTEGWKRFYEDHGLKVGYVLAFHYTINSHFVVQIFDNTGFEKLNFPVANGKKRKRSEIDGNCNAVGEGQNLSNHSTKKNAALSGTSDSEARTHGQPMSKDKHLSLENENGKYQHVASVNCDADPLCMINRDVVFHHEEDRTPLLNLLNSEMQFGVEPDGISDKGSRPTNTLTESDAIAGNVNEKPVSAKVVSGEPQKPVSAKVVSGEPPAEVAASTLSNNKSTSLERENVAEVDNDYRGGGSTVSTKRAIEVAARNKKHLRKDPKSTNRSGRTRGRVERNNEVRRVVKTEPVNSSNDGSLDESAIYFRAIVGRHELLELPESVTLWASADKKVVLLGGPDGRVWPVLYYNKHGIKALTSGWERFFMSCMLQTGDECAFTLEDEAEAKFRIDVNRNVEELIYRKYRGKLRVFILCKLKQGERVLQYIFRFCTNREACEECKLKCSFIHGHEKGPSPSVTTFHKILSGVHDFSKDLCLPHKVSQTIPVLVAGQIHFLEDSNNQVWKVMLGTKDGHLAFGKGWDKFSADHGLREGYTLAFHYMVSHFVVQIIDETGIEKLEFPVENGKKRKRSESDENCNAVGECQNVSNTTTKKKDSNNFGTLDNVARTHSQAMSKDKPSGKENGNGTYQHVSSADCGVEQFCMVNRDTEYKYKEDRSWSPYLDISNLEMQFRVDLDGSRDKGTISSSTPTESNAVAGISNENPVSAKVVSGEPPVEVDAFKSSKNKNVPSKRENMEVADSGHYGERLKFEEAAGKKYLKLNNEVDEIFGGDKENEVRKAVKSEPVVLVIDDSMDSSALSFTTKVESRELLDVTEHTQENVQDASPSCYGQLTRIERLKFQCKDRKDLLRVFAPMNEKYRGKTKRSLSLNSLVRILNDMELGTEERREQYKKLICFYVIDQVLLPSSKDGFCRSSYFKYFNDLSVCEGINWAQETLDAIHRAALRIKAKQSKTFDACSSVFEAMILSRIPKLIPSNAKINDTLVLANKYPSIRRKASKWNEQLSMLNPDDIQSCPYCD